MRNLIVFLHLAAAIFWMGGMAFMVLALRPVLHEQLQPPQRLPLITAVLGRFFVVVAASIAVLLATGVWLLLQVPGQLAPAGWHVMSALGLVMMAIFGYIWFAPYKRLKAAVAAANWPEGGKNAMQVTLLAKVNLGIGWVAIAAVLLWR
ncbi:MAG: CopD family protein [Burkholderiales bacterium]|nr:CopD family protein [Burkholderiales bacterium]